MAGIYLHIPFCKQACTYCNFHFTTSLRYKDDLVNALAGEAEAEKGYLNGEIVHTLYFGGGTPSLLAVADLGLLISALKEHYPLAPDAEITLEANPDDVTKENVRQWKGLGINRLSIGIQSFFEEELRWMNRAHNATQAKACIEASYEAGIDNLSIDLIYGSPLLTDAMWEQNVKTAIAYNIKHLSCYALTVEEKTPLHKNILQHKTLDVDSEKQARQFLQLMHWLRTVGYEHYEVSNFAKPGFRSRHNSSYWKGTPYLGLGPSAHSFNGTERRWNIPNNNVYIKTTNEGSTEREAEVLSLAQQLNETIMISLRTMEGIDLNKIQETWGEGERRRMEAELAKYINHGLVQIHQQHAQLTDEGMLRADGIAADLFV
ncbi:radical SAM family heme chaperone HemW [Flavisolibacter nicotianae]|uniref:radical SAM family heme chaperone HemW n=1 Tax=Flavisolibacter nicotianae TaxID=2364882 RepID=UPI000EAD9664|nr:radical SAM family heme chaperone HemW [Flavisolibacter nicotianae]